MIQDFSVDNFLSFGSRQEFSFEASNDNTSESSLIVPIKHPKTGAETRLLRMCAVYGPNASGKTNLLTALYECWSRLYTPFSSRDEKVPYRPFAMRKGENTRMEVSFFIEGVRYVYKIEYNHDAIVYELLEFNPKGVLSQFYERIHNPETNMPKITFGKNVGLDSKAISALSTNTLPNHSVLSTYNKISVEAPAFDKIIAYIRGRILHSRKTSSINEMLKTTLAESPKRGFLLRAIRQADFNIKDIISKEEKNSDVRIEFEHSYAGGSFHLPIEAESAGTLSFVEKIDSLYEMLQRGQFLAIDEIDSSIHHDLLVYFFQAFLSNESQAQLLFTMHDQLILSEDFMRRDMVWFTEKDKETSSTELFSADDFNLHKNASILNAYRLGKFGAKPSVGSPFLTNSPSSL